MPEPKKKQNRHTERVMVSLYPDDLRKLDEIAEKLAEPGAEPNRSHAVRYLVRNSKAYLKQVFGR